LKPGRSGFTVRVAVVIVRGNRILLGRHRKRGTDYWIVPGGRLEPGESLVQCGRREILEETGLQVDLGPLLYIGEFQGKGFRVLDFFFLGSSPDGDPVPGYDPEDSGPERVFQDFEMVVPGRTAFGPITSRGSQGGDCQGLARRIPETWFIHRFLHTRGKTA